MSVWSFLFSGSARVKRHRELTIEIERLSEARRDTVQVAQSQARVMATMAGAMQMMARKATDNAS